MKTNPLLAGLGSRELLLTLTLLLNSAALSSAAVSTVGSWGLGDSDPGATNGGAANGSTTASVGSDLTKSGSIFYSSDKASGASGNFSVRLNDDGAYYSTTAVLTGAASTSNFGMEGWFKVGSGQTGTGILFYNGNTGSTGAGLFYQAEEGNLNFLAGGVAVVALGNIQVNTWYYAAFVFDGTTGSAYFAKEGDALTSVSLGTGINAVNGGSFMVGGLPGNANETFSGNIDNVRVFTFGTGEFQTNQLSFVPEPSAALLGMVGALGLGMRRSRRGA